MHECVGYSIINSWHCTRMILIIIYNSSAKKNEHTIYYDFLLVNTLQNSDRTHTF